MIQKHCIHCGEAPGEFLCCRCYVRSTGFPGDSMSKFNDRICIPTSRFGPFLRHYGLAVDWTLKYKKFND